MASLITLEEYKKIKNLGRTGEEDRIKAHLEPVSDLVRRYCNRQFTTYVGKDDVREVWTYWAEPFVAVQEVPLISISKVTIDKDEFSDYTFQKATGQVRPKEGMWEQGKFIRVTYRGGYTTVPEDLKLAIVDLIVYYYKSEYRETKSTQGVVLEQPGTSSVRNDSSFPDHIRRVLDLYKLEKLDAF